MSGSSYLILLGQIVNSRRFAHVPERALEPRLPVPFGEASWLCTWGCVCVLKGEIWGVFCATGVGVPVEEVYIGWWGRLKSLPALSSRRIQDFPTRVHRILYALADLDSATPVGPPLHPPGILQGEKHFRAWRKISSLYSNLILYWFTFSGLGKLK
jgi:hypothetical protein